MARNVSKLLQIVPNDYGRHKWLWQWPNIVPTGPKWSVFSDPGTWDRTMFLVKKKNVEWFVMKKRHLNSPGPEKVWISPLPTLSWNCYH